MSDIWDSNDGDPEYPSRTVPRPGMRLRTPSAEALMQGPEQPPPPKETTQIIRRKAVTPTPKGAR